MLLKNFFGGTIEVNSEEEIENVLRMKYNLSKKSYRIFKTENEIFISFSSFLRNNNDISVKIIEKNNTKPLQRVPDELKELGILEEDYQELNECSIDEIKRYLLPYTFKCDGKFNNYNIIDKMKFDGFENFIKEITIEDKNNILKNAEAYIDRLSNCRSD
jgi:hypothetical protein